jgi:hypothetical protein
MSGLDPAAVRSLLEANRVTVLAVTASPRDAGRLVVYLHGNDGLPKQERALRILRAQPSVRDVRESPVSWAILVVTLVKDETSSG